MKRIALFVALTAVLVVSCSDPQDPNPSYKSKGIINGIDVRRCIHPCCGGWFIEIDGTRYRFFELPPNSNVQLSETNYPIPVRLSWSLKGTDSHPCEGDVIIIHAIAKE